MTVDFGFFHIGPDLTLPEMLVDSIKKVAKGLPMYLSVTSGLHIDPVFQKLGFKNLGSNWRLN